MQLIHHGGHRGVTGSCHQLKFANGQSLLVDCGLFQGDDARRNPNLEIEFSLDGINTLILTHVHIDHVGRLPYLLAAGFEGRIYCSRPTAYLLPLVMEDALRIGFTRNDRLIRTFLDKVAKLLRPMEYGSWQETECGASIRLNPAGHVLGSAFVEVDADAQRTVFSGDLGSTNTPLLRDPKSPEHADLLVLESTYGDKIHEGRETRQERLEAVLRHTLDNKGVTIIPAFSLGRTQELLYEMNGIFERIQQQDGVSLMKQVDVIVDSPLASRFTEIYKQMEPYYDAETQRLLKTDDQPLVFENLTTIGDHDEHTSTLEYLKSRGLPAIVIAGSGMCTGGRVVNYLKAFIEDPTTDVVFVGYQGAGTEGRMIQRKRHWVEYGNRKYQIRANVHTIGGYSAHADQQNLVDFVKGMQGPPGDIVLVHGEDDAKEVLRDRLTHERLPVRD